VFGEVLELDDDLMLEMSEVHLVLLKPFAMLDSLTSGIPDRSDGSRLNRQLCTDFGIIWHHIIFIACNRLRTQLTKLIELLH
jgi:hypothetical protein